MLQRVHIKNFKCLRSVSTTLTPLTLLIGPNDSGKTSFLQAIDFFRRLASDDELFATHESRAPASSLDSLVFSRNLQQEVFFETDIVFLKPSLGFPSDRKVSYRVSAKRGASLPKPIWMPDETLRMISLKGQGSPPVELLNKEQIHAKAGGPRTSRKEGKHKSDLAWMASFEPKVKHIADFFRSFRVFQLRSEVMCQAGKIENVEAQQAPELGRYGEGLVDLLDWILTEHRKTFLALEKTFCELCTTIEQINLPRHEMGEGQLGRRLEFVLRQTQAKVDASMISEGHLMLLGYLTLLYHPQRPKLLLLEEPESHLHPGRIEFLFQLLRQISDGSLGLEPCQVILTTHNPQFLNYAKPEEVRVFFRNKETSEISITPFSEAKDLQQMLKIMNLGEIWYNLGEEELVHPS